MPNNWKTYKLGEVADVQNGYAFKSKDMGESGIPVIKIKNIVPPNINLDGAGYYVGEIEPKLSKYVIRKNDFLISMTGSTVNVMTSAVGKMGRYRLDDISLLNQRAGKIYVTDPEILDFDYMCHYLARYSVHYNLALNATGSANQANISPAQIKDIKLNLPPLKTQKAIASILSALDDKIELNLQMNKTLEDMAMALYKHWFVDFGPFQNGEFVDSELGEIPKGWEVKSIDSNIDYQKGYAFKSKFYQTTGKTIVRVSDTTHNSINVNTCNRISFENSKGLDKYELNTNDVVIATVGSWPPNYSSVVGKVIKVPETANDSLLNQNAVRLRLILDNELHQELLYYNLKTDKFMNYLINRAQGSASQASVKLTDIFNYKIVIPDLSILNDFKSVINPIEQQRNSLDFENETLTKTRDTLLPKLISGAIQVKDVEQLLN